MGYAIVGYFNSQADQKIKEIWKGLAVIGVDDYLINSANNPHFKLDMFSQLDLDYTRTQLSEITKNYQKIDLHFKKFGLYPNKEKPFITIDIAENLEIITLQKEIHDQFAAYGAGDMRGFFQPGIWKPDCQLTRQFEKEKLAKAVEYLNSFELPFNGTLEKIGVIEFHPAKQLFAYPLI